MEEMWKNSAIIAKRNVDDNQNPISVQLSELKQVMGGHSCIVLNQLPDEFQGISVDGYTEVFDIEKISDKTYKVDYANGIVYFHPNNIEKMININYYGIGYTLISASRVYTKYDKYGNVLETLEELIDKAKLHFEMIESMGKAVNIIRKLDEDVKAGVVLHENLSNDIEQGTLLNADLKINIQQGDVLLPKMEDANIVATQKKEVLDESIKGATNINVELSNTNESAIQTDLTLKQTLTNAQSNVDKIISVGNKFIIVNSSQFNGSREYNWKHDMNNDNLVVNFIDSTTKEPLVPDYKIVDKNNMILRNSVEHPNIKVIASASNWQGVPLTGTVAEDFSGTTIEVGSNVRLKDVNGYKYPVTKAEAVYMPDGTTKVTEKIQQIEEQIGQSSGLELDTIKLQLAEIMNNIPSYSIINYAKFNRNNVRKGYEISLYGGLTQYTGLTHSDVVIDEMLPVIPSSKYEVLVYQAEDIYITEYSKGVFVGQTRLSNGYRWVYGSGYNLEEYGSTYEYTSPSAFSYFITKMNTDTIKVSFKCSEHTTSPSYFPNSNTLMLDNAIGSLKIVRVSQSL